MGITEVLNGFNSKVESTLFPFMASLGYIEFRHSSDEESEAFSKYEFIKDADRISVYLGLNRLDYNSGIQLRVYSTGNTGSHTKDVKHPYLGYLTEQLDQSMQEIKRCVKEVLLEKD